MIPGDIWCTFGTLQSQLRTGLSAQTSGFGLWTTDIGGFTADPQKFGGGCNPSNGSYGELIVRWFQFGVTCPIFRQHGSRDTVPWVRPMRIGDPIRFAERFSVHC